MDQKKKNLQLCAVSLKTMSNLITKAPEGS